MVYKSIIGATCACLAVVSLNVNAAIISVDWKSTGDDLITRDTVSGLDWLDLTVTDNMSFNQATAELNVGGLFEGWRYATRTEVVGLWANFNIDLTFSHTAPGYLDPNIEVATTFLGNTVVEYKPDELPFGVLGHINEFPSATTVTRMGSYYNAFDDLTYYNVLNDDDRNVVTNYAGSYFVRVSSVPIPPAIWLFGSGLIGLIGFTRRKAWR